MTIPPEHDIWAGLVDRFVDGHYGSIRGRVRTRVIDRHLADHLPPPPASVVDVGGGAGTQSLPLARRGYEVCVVDSSPAMLECAAATLASEPDRVASRVRLVEAAGERAAVVLGDTRFDAVLCHGVLPYVDDPRPLVESLCGLAAPGGVVSIVAKNKNALAVPPAVRGDWSAALEAFDSRREVNRLGLDTRADTVEELGVMLQELSVEPVTWYGVRLFTDWTETEPDIDQEDALTAVELEASRRDPYRRLSRLFHVIGEKKAGRS